ncbi:MAG TPA: hypothetical protein VF816_08115 [Rhodocyclaceae bacterium]
MSQGLYRVAEVVEGWGRRGDLSESDRGFARDVRELAAFLSRRPFPHHEDVASLHILGCRLCQRVGAAECSTSQSRCALGFPEAQ